MPAARPIPRVIRESFTYGLRFQKRAKLITEADLVNAVNGGVADVPFAFLPPNALMCRTAVKLNAQFTGGGASAVGVTIGTSASPALIMASFNVFGSAASGLFVAGAAGPQVESPSANGQSLIARFTPDAGHNLSALTAGSVELAIYFWGGADGVYDNT